eukprot:1158849-Pelagomonas_calceolata.AAC.1
MRGDVEFARYTFELNTTCLCTLKPLIDLLRFMLYRPRGPHPSAVGTIFLSPPPPFHFFSRKVLWNRAWGQDSNKIFRRTAAGGCGYVSCISAQHFFEQLLSSIVFNLHNSLTGVYKSGGSLAATPMDFTRCVESAKLRYKELAGLIEQALAPDADD